MITDLLGIDIPIWWFLARATGIVALFAMGASVAFGVLLSTRLLPDRRRPAWLLDVHRWVSGIAVLGLGVHLAALVADSYLTFGWREIFVPYASGWEPFAVMLGVLSLWSLVIGTAAAVYRKRLSRQTWLVLHRLTYASFWLSCLHAGLAGTDAGNRLYQVLAAVLMTLIAFLVLYRMLVTEPPKRIRVTTRPAAAPVPAEGREAEPAPKPRVPTLR